MRLNQSDQPFVIRVTGPESSGKSSLAARLAAALDGIYVAEAARDYLTARNGKYTEGDLPAIWSAQKEAEDAARASSASFVVCDTGPEVIAVWAEVRYGRVPPALAAAVRDRNYDLTLLCYPDLTWEPDPLREAPDENLRKALFEKYFALVPEANVISGSARTEQALTLI